MKPKYYVISGRAGSGKDTVAYLLQTLLGNLDTPLERIVELMKVDKREIDNFVSYDQQNHCYKRVAFAEPLKKIVSEIVPCPLENLYDQESKEQVVEVGVFKGYTHREVMTSIGDVLRNVNEDVFASALLLKTQEENTTYIITDCRMLSEYNFMKNSSSCCFIKVINTNEAYDVSTSEHPSETEVDLLNADYTIFNDKTKDITDLIDQIKLVIQ